MRGYLPVVGDQKYWCFSRNRGPWKKMLVASADDDVGEFCKSLVSSQKNRLRGRYEHFTVGRRIYLIDEARRKYINGKLSRATFTSILRAAGQEPARLSLKSILTLGGFFLLIVAGYVCLVVLYA